MKINAPSTSTLVGFIDKMNFDLSRLCFRVRITSSFPERVQTRGRKFYRGLFAPAQTNLYKQVMFDIFCLQKISNITFTIALLHI
jgi:hypothetical protein